MAEFKIFKGKDIKDLPKALEKAYDLMREEGVADERGRETTTRTTTRRGRRKRRR